MATLDLGQFDEEVISARSWGPATRRVRVHVVQVTESEREERCSCGAVIPAGGELYLLNGKVECPQCYHLTARKLKPARGYYPEQHFGRPQTLERRRRSMWRRR